MKKMILLLILLSGCDNSFNPNGPYNEKLVVYGLFTTKGDTQFVWLSTTYPAPGAIPNHVAGARVTVSQANTTYELRDTVLRGMNSAGQPVDVQGFVSYGLHLEPAMQYTLSVSSPVHGRIQAHAEGLYRGRMIALTNSLRDIFVRVTLGANVRAYIVKMYLEYLVGVDTGFVTKRAEVARFVTDAGEFLYPRPTSSELGTAVFTGGAYVASVARIRQQNPRGILLKKSVFVLTELDSALYAYYSTANAFPESGTLRLDEPDYTNIEGGLGVFGMTSETVLDADTSGNQ